MSTTNNKVVAVNTSAPVGETPPQRLDRLVHAAIAPAAGGLSPVALALATVDWAWHLGVSPGRQLELAALAWRLGQDTLQHNASPDDASHPDDDPRFRHEAWTNWPFSQIRTGFRNAETFWREAATVPGMTAHHAHMTQFFAKQWLGMLAPANWLPTNPVVLQDVVESNGAHLLKGLQNWLNDIGAMPASEAADAPAQHYLVGRDVAVTPGKVVFRNHLIELIRYEAQTDKVHPEPVLIVPSWIMKYYILDLSPHNSLVRYLVEQGHTVYMLSWRNPDASDHDLTMDDYLRLGIIDALHTIGKLSGMQHGVHAMGYCLGGTLMAIAATLGRRGGMSDYAQMPNIATLSLLAAQTDFSQPGELGLFIDESQLAFLEDVTRGKGYLTGKQMAGSFQFLHSRDLVWTRRMNEYLMGEREHPNDLMAWNADTTRLPARMHREYLTSLYLNNALASSAYQVRGRGVSLSDIRMPVFMVGTQRDHVSPWQSVYKLHHLCDAEITFVLTSGGHNAGIISEPGHHNRSYQMQTRAAHSAWVGHQEWAEQAPHFEGSWWPAWQQWLAAHSSHKVAARPIPAKAVLCDAPGTYVMQRYQD